MLRIELRRIDETRAEAATAAKALVAAGADSDAAFLTAAWNLAQTLAPVGSTPVNYLLNPANQSYCAQLLEFIPESDYARDFGIDGPSTHDLFRHDILEVTHRLMKIFAATMQEAIGAYARPKDERRRWIMSALLTLSCHERLPAQLCSRDWIHLGSYAAFHFGTIRAFAKTTVNFSTFKTLPIFWQGYLRWHAGMRDTETTRILVDVIQNKEVSAGTRKTALLLLWTESSLESGALNLITRSHASLLRPTVQYRGSPPLPVKQDGATNSRPDKEILSALTQAVEVGRNRRSDEDISSISGLVKELLGASAELESIVGCVKKIRDPSLRAFVTGGGEADRLSVLRVLAALTGRTETQWTKWTSVSMRQNLKALERETTLWQTSGACGTKLKSIEGRALIAMDLQKWTKRSIDILVELLREPVSLNANLQKWPDAVIASRDRAPQMTKHPFSQALLDKMSIHVDLERVGNTWYPPLGYVPTTYDELAEQTGENRTTLHERLPKTKYRNNPVIHRENRRTYVLKAWLDANRKRST